MTSWELRVSIDISKPLCRGRFISLADEGNDWVSFRPCLGGGNGNE